MSIDPRLPIPTQEKINVAWLDVNTLLGIGNRADLCPNIAAINNSLYNLFRCPIGARGPIFQPDYGSSLVHLLHEPMDYITANKLKMYIVQAVQRWEPRINLDLGNTTVDPDYTTGTYVVSVAYVLVATSQSGTGDFLLSKI